MRKPWYTDIDGIQRKYKKNNKMVPITKGLLEKEVAPDDWLELSDKTCIIDVNNNNSEAPELGIDNTNALEHGPHPHPGLIDSLADLADIIQTPTTNPAKGNVRATGTGHKFGRLRLSLASRGAVKLRDTTKVIDGVKEVVPSDYFLSIDNYLVKSKYSANGETSGGDIPSSDLVRIFDGKRYKKPGVEPGAPIELTGSSMEIDTFDTFFVDRGSIPGDPGNAENNPKLRERAFYQEKQKIRHADFLMEGIRPGAARFDLVVTESTAPGKIVREDAVRVVSNVDQSAPNEWEGSGRELIGSDPHRIGVSADVSGQDTAGGGVIAIRGRIRAKIPSRIYKFNHEYAYPMITWMDNTGAKYTKDESPKGFGSIFPAPYVPPKIPLRNDISNSLWIGVLDEERGWVQTGLRWIQKSDQTFPTGLKAYAEGAAVNIISLDESIDHPIKTKHEYLLPDEVQDFESIPDSFISAEIIPEDGGNSVTLSLIADFQFIPKIRRHKILLNSSSPKVEQFTRGDTLRITVAGSEPDIIDYKTEFRAYPQGERRIPAGSGAKEDGDITAMKEWESRGIDLEFVFYRNENLGLLVDPLPTDPPELNRHLGSWVVAFRDVRDSDTGLDHVSRYFSLRADPSKKNKPLPDSKRRAFRDAQRNIFEVQSELSQSVCFVPGFDEERCIISDLRIAFDQAANADVAPTPTSQVGSGAQILFNWGNDIGDVDDPKAGFNWQIPNFSTQISDKPNNGKATITIKTGGRSQGVSEEDVAPAPAGETAHRHEWNIEVAPGTVTMWDDRPWGFARGNSPDATEPVPINPDSD